MANPFYTQNNGMINNQANNTAFMQQFKNIFNSLKNSQNPNALINQMIQQNPQMAQTLNMFRGQNVNYEKVFRDLCQQRGLDADFIIKNIMG